MFGTESWLDDNIQSSEVFPDNFTSYGKDRVGDPHGGVFLLIRNSLISSEETSLVIADAELTWVKVCIAENKDLLLGSFYRPPSTDGTYLEKLDDSMAQLSNTNSNVWLAGDFYLPHIDWQTDSITSKCQNRQIHDQLLDIANSRSLSQVVTKSTRGENTLDLFFTNNDSLVNRVETLPGMSDHDIVLVESEITQKRAPQPKRKLLLYNKGNYDKIKEELKSFEQDFNEIDKGSVSKYELWSIFKTKMEEFIEKHIPSKLSTKRHEFLYFNRELSKSNKTLHKAFRKRNLTAKANTHYKSVKALFQRKLRQA